LVQPDGTTFAAVPWGVATANGYEDLDGHTVARDDAGVWRYTVDGEPSGVRPDDGGPPAGAPAHDRPPVPDADGSGAAGAPASELPSEGPHVPFNTFTGTLVILAQFPDQPSVGSTAASWASSYFGETNSVQDYYQDQSANFLHLTPVDETHGTVNDGVVGWVTLPSNHPNTNGLSGSAQLAAQDTTVRDAIVAADPYVDFARYDRNGDGVIEPRELHIVVIAAGYETAYGGAAVQCGKNVWGHQGGIGGSGVTAPTVDGKVAGGAGHMLFGEWHCTTSESPGHAATIGIMAHEMGHDLDMPDLYDIDGSSEGIGEWSLMASASWNAVGGGFAGSTPGGLDPFTKSYQGWLTPTHVGGTSTAVALQQVETSPQVVRVLDNPNGVDWNFYEQSGTGEYFLIENRQKVGYDAGIPGCGVLIWHVDETRTSTNSANATDGRRLIDLEEADGLNHLDTNTNRGDAGDPYPGSAARTSFANATSPNSKLYSGAASGVSVGVPNSACASTANITVTGPQSVPFAPTIGTATAGNGQATVTWTAPTDDGGAPITGYKVTPYIGTTAQTPQTFSSTATSQVVTGLTNTTTYTFKVAAVNAVGTGPLSAETNAVTPVALASAPTIGSATAGTLSATVSWTAPSSSGTYPITGYRVTAYYSLILFTTRTFTSTATTQVVTGLSGGTSYTFRVAAITQGGVGANSAASNSVTPAAATAPGAPTIGTATKGAGSATVTWTAPASDGGSAITGYHVTPYVGATAQTVRVFNSTATSQVVASLTNGTAYTFKVAAVNAVGTGTQSAASSSVTPSTLPGAPTIGTATPGSKQATVRWTAPASNGSAITGYKVTPYIGATAQTVQTFNSTATSQAVTGLTNGTAYTFKVAAVNANGTGNLSAASNSVTPSGGVAADFDGDGTTDVAVFRPSNGGWYIAGSGVTYLGLDGDIPVPADYDGDGASEIAVFRPSTGAWFVDGQPSATYFGLSGDVPVPGDYDGDGTTDLAVFRPSNGGWYRYGGGVAYHGLATDTPVPADYDGDGATDRAVFRPSTGAWFVDGQATRFTGGAGDVPLPGDYDGNGTTDVAVFRPSQGAWYRSGLDPLYFGLDTDVPVPGQFDADPATDVAVFRAGDGGWYVDGSPATFFGLVGDIPAPRNPALS
jgi:M6 family metalloprotease-like protein